jgi:hypothetical protein
VNNRYKINGYDVQYTYAGLAQYTVYKDGEDLGTCWSIADLARMTEIDAATVNEEVWKQK